jgi:AAA domain
MGGHAAELAFRVAPVLGAWAVKPSLCVTNIVRNTQKKRFRRHASKSTCPNLNRALQYGDAVRFAGVVWLHGAFGAGKSSVAAELRRRDDDLIVFDPEAVGYMLREIVPVPTGDFQDLPQWRELVVVTAATLSRHSDTAILAPMTLLRQTYLHEIVTGLRGDGVDVIQVLLDATDEELRRRIDQDDALPTDDEVAARTTRWRLDKLSAYRAARPWLRSEVDVVIDTDAMPVTRVADAVEAVLRTAASS